VRCKLTTIIGDVCIGHTVFVHDTVLAISIDSIAIIILDIVAERDRMAPERDI
jgi:hypothetical protein